MPWPMPPWLPQLSGPGCPRSTSGPGRAWGPFFFFACFTGSATSFINPSSPAAMPVQPIWPPMSWAPPFFSGAGGSIRPERFTLNLAKTKPIANKRRRITALSAAGRPGTTEKMRHKGEHQKNPGSLWLGRSLHGYEKKCRCGEGYLPCWAAILKIVGIFQRSWPTDAVCGK